MTDDRHEKRPTKSPTFLPCARQQAVERSLLPSVALRERLAGLRWLAPMGPWLNANVAQYRGHELPALQPFKAVMGFLGFLGASQLGQLVPAAVAVVKVS